MNGVISPKYAPATSCQLEAPVGASTTAACFFPNNPLSASIPRRVIDPTFGGVRGRGSFTAHTFTLQPSLCENTSPATVVPSLWKVWCVVRGEHDHRPPLSCSNMRYLQIPYYTRPGPPFWPPPQHLGVTRALKKPGLATARRDKPLPRLLPSKCPDKVLQ